MKVSIVNHCNYNGGKVKDKKNMHFWAKYQSKSACTILKLKRIATFLWVYFLAFSWFFSISLRKWRFNCWPLWLSATIMAKILNLNILKIILKIILKAWKLTHKNFAIQSIFDFFPFIKTLIYHWKPKNMAAPQC